MNQNFLSDAIDRLVNFVGMKEPIDQKINRTKQQANNVWNGVTEHQVWDEHSLIRTIEDFDSRGFHSSIQPYYSSIETRQITTKDFERAFFQIDTSIETLLAIGLDKDGSQFHSDDTERSRSEKTPRKIEIEKRDSGYDFNGDPRGKFRFGKSIEAKSVAKLGPGILGDIVLPPLTDENFQSDGIFVGDMFYPDSGYDGKRNRVLSDLAGIVLVGDMTDNAGRWQFCDNQNPEWTDVGTISNDNGLLLLSDAKIRYVPDGSTEEDAVVVIRPCLRSTSSTGERIDLNNAVPSKTVLLAETGTVSISVKPTKRNMWFDHSQLRRPMSFPAAVCESSVISFEDSE